MRATPRPSTFAPFSIRAFRFQWPADLATSWAFEMETLILGWYVLVETQSVLLLTFFVSLQHLGTLISPMFGVMGDRLGHRNVLCVMRGFYALLATTLMTFTFLGVLTPVHVFILAGLLGLVRPSDIGMRAALVGDTMPAPLLVGAMGVQRTTVDSAKIIGALTGAGLVTALGMGPAYLVVASFYLTSVFLTLKAGAVRHRDSAAETTPPKARASPWRDLKAGLAYVWNTPQLLALMLLAFLLNLTAFPVFNGLLPYVAKDIYVTDQRGLGFMVAGAAAGALIGSLFMSRHGRVFQPGRVMIVGSFAWFAFLLVFAHVWDHVTGIVILFLAGLAQSVSQVPMAAMLLRTSDEQYRGRVMGIRMLVIYGNIPGLLLAGQLIPRIGYPLTASLYCVAGIVFTLLIALSWRRDVWRRDAPVNAR
ncbi:MAG TPA: MFS transporter [Burkholderiales bacterium]|nr:MFS transporter [Burkholderiales bacterium]